MTESLKAAIVKALDAYGIDPASKGYGYMLDAVALLLEEE